MLNRIDHGTIDPTNLSPEQNQLLTKLIQQCGTTLLFDPNKTYSLLEHHTTENQSQTHVFKLSHYILVRARKQNKTGKRFEVTHPDASIGRGGYGFVFKSSGVLIMEATTESNHLRFKEKARAIKQQEDGFVAIREYNNAARLAFLGAKPLTIVKSKNKKRNK